MEKITFIPPHQAKLLPMIYVYLKDTLSILLPFFLIHLFLQYFYQTSLFSVVIWWFKYFLKMDYKEVLLIGAFFTFFSFWASIGAIIQNISLAFHGEEHRMVYAGNIAENQSLLYHAKDLTLPPIKEYNFVAPALTFKNIYHETIFVRDKNTDRLGAPKTHFSLGSLLQVFWVMLILSPIFLGLLHALAYPVSISIETLDFSPKISLGDAFTAKLAQYGISPLKLVAFPIVMIFLPLFLPSFSDKDKNKFLVNKNLSLPIIITPNNQVSVLPIHSFREIIESISDGQDTDTGIRNIIFKFKEDFKLPVYVSYQFDSKEFPELEQLADNNIKHGIPMKVKILDDLSLELVR